MNEENKQWINDVSKTDYVDRLRKELKHNKMSQKEFAEKCGCSPSRISALLRRAYSGHTPKYIWSTARKYLKMDIK